MKIVGNKKTAEFLKGFFGISENVVTIADGDSLDLGKHVFFHLTPMVHWPETMVTYESKEKILFSGGRLRRLRRVDRWHLR